MAITKDKKAEILGKLEGILSEAKSVAFVNFHGLSVAEERELRRALREQGVGYTVAKKTLIRKALESKGVSGTLPELTGEVAVAYSADALAPARETHNFAKTHKEHLQLIGGVFEGAFMNKDEIGVIASIPGIDTLRAQFVQLINSPLSRFAIALNEVAKSREA